MRRIEAYMRQGKRQGWWRRLSRSEEGLAFLEFALAMPLLLLLLLGGVEYSRYVQASQKADKLTHTIVDLVAQAPTISVSSLNQIFEATQHIMSPHNFAQNGVIIVSCVGYNDQNQLVVKWQHRGGGTLARNSKVGTAGNAPTLPAGFTVESRDNVIIAESYFYFRSLINDSLVAPIEFYRTAFYLPRLGELGTLNPN